MVRIIHLAPPQFKRLRYRVAEVRALFHWLDCQPEHRVPQGELSVSFLDEASLAQVHGDFLDDPTPTDVITFPGDPDHDFGGEILVSAERAVFMAQEHGLTFPEELSLYLIHGWLHLAGLDDREPEDREAMRAGEKLLMNRLRAESRVPHFLLKGAPNPPR